MKTRMSGLSGDSLIAALKSCFEKVQDHRNPLMIRIRLSDFLMSGFAIFSLRFGSLLQFDEEMRKEGHRSRLIPIYKIEDVPSDTHFRTVLDEVSSSEIRPAFKKLFSELQKSKHLEGFKFFESQYLLAVDGTEHYTSEKVECDACMKKKTNTNTEKEGVRYYHQMLAGSLVHPDLDVVIPLCPEPILKQDGSEKNDSERNALRRFLDQFRNDHPKLPVILTADALHATGPLIRDLKYYDMDYILAVKPGSHQKLFEAIPKWEDRGEMRYFVSEEEIGQKVKKKRMHQFRYMNRTLLNHADVEMSVNFFEYWETTQWADQWGELQEEKKHFSFVTSFTITENNIMQLMRGGRARWKIENETFNTLKNQGYEFEHNFGHGNKNLATNLAYLMFLAFLFDQLQHLGCSQYQKILKRLKRKLYLSNRLRNGFSYAYTFGVFFENWADFLEKVAGRGPPEPLANTG